MSSEFDRLDIGVGIAVIHFTSNTDPPFSGAIGVGHVDRDSDHDRRHVAPIELPHQHHDDQQQLYDRRRQLQDHHADDGFDSVAPAFEHARQPAGLSLEMKSEGQLVHMHERAVGEPTNSVHRHFGKQAVAQLRQRRHKDSHAAVCDGHRDGRGDGPEQPIGGRYRRGAFSGERIRGPLEGERDRDRRELSRQQQRQ